MLGPMCKALMNAAILLLLAIVPIVNAQTTSGDVNLDRLTEAAGAIGDNQLQRAEGILNAVLATAPRDADALNLLGVVRAKQNRPAEAERLFRRALANLPSHVGAHINLAELLLSSNKTAEALPVLVRAPKLAPERADITLKLATVLSDLKRADELKSVASDFRQSTAAEPETQVEFALLLARGGLNEEALGILEAARQNAPASFPVLYALGVVMPP